MILILESILVVIHLLQKCGYFILLFSYHIGRIIFLVLSEVYTWIRDIIAICVVIGEEFYRFFYELNGSIDAVLVYVRTSTNCSINSLFRGIWIFARKIGEFFSSTKVHTRLLATKFGSFIIDLLTLVKGGLMLIADSFWWLIMLLPRTLWYLVICFGDALVFSVNGIIRFTMRTTQIFLDDIFRLSIGVTLIYLAVKHRYFFLQLLCFLSYKIQAFCHAFVLKLCLYWHRARGQQANVITQPPASSPSRPRIRRSPLPRNSDSRSTGASPRSSNAGEKLTEAQHCVVCRDQPKSVVLLPCKHLCLCEDCADYLVLQSATAGGDTCPLCRTRVERSMSVYI